jgi:hypothetical protein
MEKEALGILACCLKWHDRIYGHKVIARTDHRALTFLESTAQHNARIARWKIILSNYQFSTEYWRASDHANCDGLSRVKFTSRNLVLSLVICRFAKAGLDLLGVRPPLQYIQPALTRQKSM